MVSNNKPDKIVRRKKLQLTLSIGPWKITVHGKNHEFNALTSVDTVNLLFEIVGIDIHGPKLCAYMIMACRDPTAKSVCRRRYAPRHW